MKKVRIIVDRPKGFRDSFGNIYPINYGFVPGIMGGDGEEQDVYILDVDQPIEEYDGEIIAVVHRRDDVETKWVSAESRYTSKEILKKIWFIEQFFDSWVELLKK